MLVREIENKEGRRIEEAFGAFQSLYERGYKHWVINFSGGKDSTTTLILAIESILRGYALPDRVDIIYADTLIEIPPIKQFAIRLINFLKNYGNLKTLPLYYHIVSPDLEDRFWVKMLGKGYPPPHQKFRWCTRRLKIKPVEKLLSQYIVSNSTAIITGVRYGESKSRDNRLIYSCKRGGECGQGVWATYSKRLNALYYAPIAYWRECDVWDFVNVIAPAWGYPTQELETKVYMGRGTRFGCWMCTVVRQDRAMEKITSTSKWMHLRPLLEFRNYVWKLTRDKETREMRKDGRPGKLKLSVRKRILEQLIKLQVEVGIPLISDSEIKYILHMWKEEEKQ